ncbi:MAG: type II toxin-antitoxin system PemK/MazF family toxin [Gemmataceae bacterium]
MKRGQVWWAHHLGPAARRPVLILSRDAMPPGHAEITVAYLTSTIRHRPVEVVLTRADGVYRTCVVNLDTINTIPKRYLKYLMCTLSPAKMDEVKRALLEAFDMK